MNNETKFTKGEWEAVVDDSLEKTAIIYLSNKGGINISGAPDCIANAHLIKTAPKLYGMLDEFVSAVEDDSFEGFLYKYKEAKKLLAEARGGDKLPGEGLEKPRSLKEMKGRDWRAFLGG